MRIDAHQHFWKFDPVRDSWINDDMKAIQRDFMPSDLKPLLMEHKLDGCVTVQSDQTEQENEFQLQNAANNDFVKGVVGWVDLRSPSVEDRLAHYSTFPKMKGFRHVLQGEPQRDLMLHPAFMNGIGLLKKYGFTYDILIFPDQLKYIPEFAAAFPEQLFVIDHIAKPDIKNGKIGNWKKDMEKAAGHPNVYCKLSGMVTEADWKLWQKENFTPYLDVVTEAFGSNRILFGSDWPVCLVAGGYNRMMEIVTDYFSSWSNEEQQLVFGENARQFYKL